MTRDGKSGLLYTIELTKIETCAGWVVFFFDGERFVARTDKLSPRAGVALVSHPVAAAGVGRFAVRYGVSASSNVSCAEFGRAGTDTYVYAWNGRRMRVVSGKPPRRPRLLEPSESPP